MSFYMKHQFKRNRENIKFNTMTCILSLNILLSNSFEKIFPPQFSGLCKHKFWIDTGKNKKSKTFMIKIAQQLKLKWFKSWYLGKNGILIKTIKDITVILLKNSTVLKR